LTRDHERYKAAQCLSSSFSYGFQSALLLTPLNATKLLDRGLLTMWCMTIDGPIRELRLDIVDICRKGITSPSEQNEICFRTSLPFAQPRLLLLLCEPTLTTFVRSTSPLVTIHLVSCNQPHPPRCIRLPLTRLSSDSGVRPQDLSHHVRSGCDIKQGGSRCAITHSSTNSLHFPP
jgi:hypothetical protein